MPRVISITQATELGTVYTVSEIQALTEFAKKNNLLIHMDGARIANAAAHLGASFRTFTSDAGVDALSFGGTKNGMMEGEAVVFFNKELSKNFKFIRKQTGQLISKMRYVSAQFLAYFDNDLWLKNAENANRMAKLLAEEVSKIPNIKVVYPVESNAVFVKLPKKHIAALQERSFFYMWNETEGIARWMTNFATTEEDIMEFVSGVKEMLGT
jgi:threonine aldolase